MNRRSGESTRGDGPSQAEDLEISAGRGARKEAAKSKGSSGESLERAGGSGGRDGRPRGEVPLALITPGQLVRITAIAGGRNLTMRLIAMGLVPGAKVSVIQNSPYGPFIVALRGTRIVLGRGMAMQVRVAIDPDDGGNG